jgi:hypothetical protein
LRKLSRREVVLLALVGVGAAVLAVRWLRPAGPGSVSPTAVHAADTRATIPRIDLARLQASRSSSEAGRRNLFAFGALVRDEPEAPVFVPTPPPPTTANGGVGLMAAATPGPPPLNVKYIGSVENATGIKVAVLVTDQKEVLTGQAGQVVANRYRVAHIGLESVDLEDVATGQSRRVPLRAQ